MKETIIGIIVFIGIVFLISAVSLGNYKIFGPAFEQTRREVFEETKSYRDGLRRDFDNLYLSYQAAKTPEEKAAVLSVIRHRASGVSPDLVPANIRQLLNN